MKNKLLYIIVVVILIIAAIMVKTKGFNLDLTYSAHEKVEVNIGKTINKNEIKQIAIEAFNKKNVKVQNIEFFDDQVLINVKNTSDEQIENLAKLVNERYGTELTKDDINIISVPAISLMDLGSKYIMPVAISFGIAILAIGIRNIKIGFWRTVIQTIIYTVVVEGLLASVYVIAQIPVNEFTMPIALLVYTITLFATAMDLENKQIELKEKKIKEEEELLKD